MDEAPPIMTPGAPPPPMPEPPKPPESGDKVKKALGPLAVIGVLLAKFKGLLIPIFKFFPVIFKTGGSMILSIGFYAIAWGWKFALGFVLLIFVHECGHLIAARQMGLKVGAPVFIPFMGAIIALKEAPKNAWIEAVVGIGGPAFGALGAGFCFILFLMTDNPLYQALAYSGFFLNLFNLAPTGFLDGGRIATAISPWLWLVGIVVMVGMLIAHFNMIVLLIIIFSVPRLISLFREKTDEEARYFEVTSAQRWTMAASYFGLIAFLVLAMKITFLDMSGK